MFSDYATAFDTPLAGEPQQSKPRRHRPKKVVEPFTDPDRSAARPPPVDALQGPPATAAAGRLESTNLTELFTLPGETASTDDWRRSFTLEGSQYPQLQPLPLPIDGQPTLWRDVPVPQPQPQPQLDNSDIAKIHRRLDELSRQLAVLQGQTGPVGATGPTGTAELFLFIAIGLLILLALDTLLRFASSNSSGLVKGGRRILGRRMRR